MVDAVAHAGLGGQMDDGAGTGSGDGSLQGGVVLQHGLGGGELGVLAQQVVTGVLEADVVVVGHAVVAVHGVPLVEQQLGQVEADEAGGSSNKYDHGSVGWHGRCRAPNGVGGMTVNTWGTEKSMTRSTQSRQGGETVVSSPAAHHSGPRP